MMIENDKRAKNGRPPKPIVMISPDGREFLFDSMREAAAKIKEFFPNMKSTTSSIVGNIIISADTKGRRKVGTFGFRRPNAAEVKIVENRKSKARAEVILNAAKQR